MNVRKLSMQSKHSSDADGEITQFPEQTAASPDDIIIGAVKIAEIPGISDTAAASIIQKQAELIEGIRADDSFCIAQVSIIHAQQKIIIIIILPGKLNSAFTGAGNAMLCKLLLSGRVDRVACTSPDFFPACSAGSDKEILFLADPADHIFKNKLRHRTPANIAVADEHYFYHKKILSRIAVKGLEMPHFARVSG